MRRSERRCERAYLETEQHHFRTVLAVALEDLHCVRPVLVRHGPEGRILERNVGAESEVMLPVQTNVGEVLFPDERLDDGEVGGELRHHHLKHKTIKIVCL